MSANTLQILDKLNPTIDVKISINQTTNQKMKWSGDKNKTTVVLEKWQQFSQMSCQV